MNFSTTHDSSFSMDVTTLTDAFASAKLDPAEFFRGVMTRARSAPPGIWIHLLSDEQISAQLETVLDKKRRGEKLPLFAVPFAIKDNIDLAGHSTTAACPAFSYVAEKTSTAVQKLQDAGAIVIGKTNLDQFATGLVGTRSPFGVCKNPFNEKFISGGSSSGSAVAVSTGLVSFALGTDTAGSGRVPAGFNNIVGLKPTRGLVSANGVVPACQSLDCVSIFALTCDDAKKILAVAEGFDDGDPYSRKRSDLPNQKAFSSGHFRFGMPRKSQLEFFGDTETESIYFRAVESLQRAGGVAVVIDFEPFKRAASLLYDGPWVAERHLVAKDLLAKDPEAMLPVTRSIIARGETISAADAFKAMHELGALNHIASAEISKVDFLLLPTAGTAYTIDEVLADPVQLNTNLGYYTNFVNLLDMSALAVPAGFRSDGVPMGVTLVAPAGAESSLLKIGDAVHRSLGVGSGIQKRPLASAEKSERTIDMKSDSPASRIEVAVVGAHLSGMPLNSQLTERGATLVRATQTAADYKFFALPGTVPPKPGMVRVEAGTGSKIVVEVWSMPIESYGSFIALIPQPLGIGTINLDDGSKVQGFLCEPIATVGATDISHLGGWRAFIASKK